MNKKNDSVKKCVYGGNIYFIRSNLMKNSVELIDTLRWSKTKGE